MGNIPNLLDALPGLLPPIFELPLSLDTAKALDDRGQMAVFVNLSQLAYENWDRILEYLGRNPGWKPSTPELISVRDPQMHFDSEAFVAANDTDIIVVFRGTEPALPADWLTDLTYFPEPVENFFQGMPGGAKVHGGFARAFAVVWPAIRAAVAGSEAEEGTPRKRLWITGHSLGGALATLAAAAFTFEVQREVTRVYSFGQPRVGDADQFFQAFQGRLQSRYLRVVNDQDLVARVPPWEFPVITWRQFMTSWFGALNFWLPFQVPSFTLTQFRHVGTVKFLDANGVGHRTLPPADYGNTFIGLPGWLKVLQTLAGSVLDGDWGRLRMSLISLIGTPRVIFDHALSAEGIVGPGYLQRTLAKDGSQDEPLAVDEPADNF